jgi:hypothetical protein
MNTRVAFQVPMTIEKLQQMIQYAKAAQENMLVGQTLTIQVDHKIDFMFSDLKPFTQATAISRESVPTEEQT